MSVPPLLRSPRLRGARAGSASYEASLAMQQVIQESGETRERIATLIDAPINRIHHWMLPITAPNHRRPTAGEVNAVATALGMESPNVESTALKRRVEAIRAALAPLAKNEEHKANGIRYRPLGGLAFWNGVPLGRLSPADSLVLHLILEGQSTRTDLQSALVDMLGARFQYAAAAALQRLARKLEKAGAAPPVFHENNRTERLSLNKR